MSFWGRVVGQAKAQFLDVIQWLDDSNNTLVYRFPVYDQAITDQSKVIVREGQAAVFVAEGQLSDVFAPGTYTLDTPNAPIRAFFRTIAYGMNNPYKGDILFVSTRQFTDQGWGTQNPFMLRDAEFGPVRVRAFGSFAFRVNDPAAFIRQIVGTDGLFTTDEITGHLKKRLVSSFASAIGQAKIPVLDLAANYDDLGEQIRDRISPKFEEDYGLTLTNLTIANISLPKEVEEALDNRSKMGILGDLNAYTKLKAADSMEAAASNPGMGGAGVGLGMGVGMGGAMGQMMGNAMGGGGGGNFNPQQGMQGPPPTPAAATFHYNGPSGQAQLSAADIAQRIAADRTANHMVWAAGWPGWKSWKDVAEIAGMVPPPAAAPSAPPPPPGAAPQVVFHYHGPSGQGQKSAAEIAKLLAAEPDATHHVWREGFDGWKPAADVPEIQAAAKPAGPPPPPAGGPPPAP